MDYFAKLVIAALAAFFSSFAFAGYAQLTPPSGWSPISVGGAPATFNLGGAANASRLVGSTVVTNSSLSVGGSLVRVPVHLRVAANLPSFASGLIFANPYLRAGASIASWLAAGALIYNATDGFWQRGYSEDKDFIPGYYFVGGFGRSRKSYPLAAQDAKEVLTRSRPDWEYVFDDPGLSPSDYERGVVYIPYVATEPGGASSPGAASVSIIRNSCPAGWSSTPAGCLSPQSQVHRVNDQAEFESILTANPMPEPVPEELPYLPVNDPNINPGPGGDPPFRPFFIPTGDPVPNPHYNPSSPTSPDNEPYIKPGVNVNPSPVPDNPWRVTLNPVNRPAPNDNPSKGPEFNPSGNPSGQPSNNPNAPPGGQSGGDKPMDNPGLCDEYPDILACAKMDDPPEKDLKEVERDIKISPDSGWGADNAACPAPKSIHPQGHTIMIPYDLFCMYMQGLRPIIIAMAWLSAAFILIGARESS